MIRRHRTPVLEEESLRLAPYVQVRHRCKCSDLAICGKELQLVEGLAAEGRLVPNAIPRRSVNPEGSQRESEGGG